MDRINTELKTVSIKILKDIDFRKLCLYFLLYSVLKAFIVPTFYLQFSSMIIKDISVGSYYLCYVVLFSILTDFIQRKLKYQKTYVSLEYLDKFVMISFGILLGTDLSKIEERKTQKFENKYNRAFAALRMLIKDSLEQIFKIPMIVGLVWIIMNISYFAIFLTLFSNFIFFLTYFKKKNSKLVKRKIKINKKTNEKYKQLWQVSYNVFDHVLHGETDYVIDTNKTNRIEIEKDWLDLEYEYDIVGFYGSTIDNIVLLVSMLHFVNSTSSNSLSIGLIIPLYTSITSLSLNVNDIILFYGQIQKWLKDYEEIKDIMDQSVPKDLVEQTMDIESFSFCNLRYVLKQDGRDDFILRSEEGVNFEFRSGDTVLIDGDSGAGKSTICKIISGTICSDLYDGTVLINNRLSTKKFHPLEEKRTMVIQDLKIDISDSCFDTVTGIYKKQSIETKEMDSEEGKITVIEFSSNASKEDESLVWFFLEMVKLDKFFKENFKGNLHLEINDRISGGQQRRLEIVKSLFRAEKKGSKILILDEPDKGLPENLKIEIMRSIIRWCRSKNMILFIILHTEKKYELDFTKIVFLKHGFLTMKSQLIL